MAQPADLATQEAGALRATFKAALFLGGLIMAGIALRLLGTGFLTAKPTLGGACVYLAAGAALTAFGMPRQAVAFAGGYAFGIWGGSFLALAAQLAGCCADFWWARAVARDWAARRLRGRLGRLDRLLAARPFMATLTLRLLPVGNNLLLNLLAGISGLRPWPFFGATLIGYLPQTAVFALAGSGVHLNRSVQLGAGILLFGVSALLGWGLLRQHVRRTA